MTLTTHEIQETTSCPFAMQANVTHATVFPESLEAADTFEPVLGALRDYIETSYNDKSDGLFLEVPASLFGETEADLARGFKDMATYFAASQDASPEEYFDGVDAPGWQLEVDGIRFFTIAFSPIYGEDHPRRSPDPDKCQIFFQPESSFDLHIIAVDGTPANLSMKRTIREKFAESGRRYDGELAGSSVESIKYIKPTTIGAPAVQWWVSEEEGNIA